MTRRKRRFALWTLFLLIAIIALPTSWCGVRMNEHYKEQAVLSKLQGVQNSIYGRTTYFGPSWLPTGYRPAWLQRVIAIDITGRTYGSSQFDSPYDAPVDFDDNDLEEIIDDLQLLPNLSELQLGFTAVSDASIENFQTLPKLSFVNGQGTRLRSNKLVARENGPDIKIHVRFRPNTKIGIGYSSP